MSATRSREVRLHALLLAGFLGVSLGSDAAWPAMPGVGFGAAPCVGAGTPRGRESGHGRVGTPFVPGPQFAHHGFGHGHHGHPNFFAVPYVAWDPYWAYEPDDAYGPEEPTPRRAPEPGFCDVSSHSYPQDCVWKNWKDAP